MSAADQGFHNPMRSFGFRELLIQLAAKDIAEGGNAVLAQNMESAATKIVAWTALQKKQYEASRLKKKAANA